MASILTHESGEVEKVSQSVAESVRMGIAVLPPSINESFEMFTALKGKKRSDGTFESDRIRFGLSSIKNFGEGISKAIIEERNTNGVFESLSNFLSRIKDKNLNKKSLEALIKAGAMDEFADRVLMFGNLDRLLEYNKEKIKNDGAQDSLFGGMADMEDIRLDPVAPITKAERLVWEKELLGLYISGHPLDRYRESLEKRPLNIAKLHDKAADDIAHEKKLGEEMYVLGCIIEDVRTIMTKKNEPMAFIKVADLSRSIEVVVFPSTYARYKNIIVPDKCIALKAKLSDRNSEVSLIAETFMALQ